MKKYLLLLLLHIPAFTYAQRTFKFAVVNALTGKPMAQKLITVLQNDKYPISFAATDSSGIYTFKVKNYDSTATFRAQISNSFNNYLEPQYADVTAVKTGIPVVKVKPSNYTLPLVCNYAYYPHYKPREIMSLQELPAFIQARVKQHLLDRVGPKFYQKIVLNGGQLIDLDTFYKLNPKFNKDKWQPPNYDLCFMVWDAVTHDSRYTFKLEMDAQGNLQRPLLLPDIVHHPAKSRIITLSRAKAIARAHGVNQPFYRTETSYNEKSASIVWELTYFDPKESSEVGWTLLIDAHTGAIIERYRFCIVI